MTVSEAMHAAVGVEIRTMKLGYLTTPDESCFHCEMLFIRTVVMLHSGTHILPKVNTKIKILKPRMNDFWISYINVSFF